MKEIIFKFEDGSEYIVRSSNMGDSIIGSQAHRIMHAMNRAHNYKNEDFKTRCQFIFNYKF